MYGLFLRLFLGEKITHTNQFVKCVDNFQIPLTDSANFFERFCTSLNWSFAEVKEIAIYTCIIDNQI